MKVMSLKIISCLVIAVLTVGIIYEIGYLNIGQDCQCCKSKSHNTAKSHKTAKVCNCTYQIAQSFLSVKDFLPKLSFTRYSLQKQDSVYLYLIVNDIFHPPKAACLIV